MTTFNQVFLSLGSNIPPQADYLRRAVTEIGRQVGEVTALSSVYRSDPWGMESSSPFFNQVVRVTTTLEAGQVLALTQRIEKKLGRLRKGGPVYHDRTIDIDLLYFNRSIHSDPELVLPHPHIAQRRFVLVPMAEVAADWKHPLLGSSQQQLLDACADRGRVWPVEEEALYEI